VGRPVDDVEAALVGHGLRVARTPQETAVAAPGTVLEIGPVGPVSPGELVTVTYATAPATPSPAPSSTTVETGGTAPSPGAVVQAATGGSTDEGGSSGPRNGNAYGHDKGKNKDK
jgi:eukaryotic-like serine/threonine-protein kinase